MAHAPTARAMGPNASTSAKLLGVLALAERFRLCTPSQKYMMLDYVRKGKFKEEYYTGMWSKRLEDHSPEAAAALQELLAQTTEAVASPAVAEARLPESSPPESLPIPLEAHHPVAQAVPMTSLAAKWAPVVEAIPAADDESRRGSEDETEVASCHPASPRPAEAELETQPMTGAAWGAPIQPRPPRRASALQSEVLQQPAVKAAVPRVVPATASGASGSAAAPRPRADAALAPAAPALPVGRWQPCNQWQPAPAAVRPQPWHFGVKQPEQEEKSVKLDCAKLEAAKHEGGAAKVEASKLEAAKFETAKNPAKLEETKRGGATSKAAKPGAQAAKLDVAKSEKREVAKPEAKPWLAKAGKPEVSKLEAKPEVDRADPGQPGMVKPDLTKKEEAKRGSKPEPTKLKAPLGAAKLEAAKLEPKMEHGSPGPAKLEQPKAEPHSLDLKPEQYEWADAPGELLRRATRILKREDEEEKVAEVEGSGSAEGTSRLVELTAPDMPVGLTPFLLPLSLQSKLRPYQRSGVLWMASLFQNSRGGILADDMGLGKTVQTCAFLNGVRREGASHVLILVPVTLLEQWANEASEWSPNWAVYIYHGSATQRANALQSVMQPVGGILLTSYSIIKREMEQGHLHNVTLGWVPCRKTGNQGANPELEDAALDAPDFSKPGSTKPWDVVICDEAHTLRNISTLVGKQIRKVQAKSRLLLTGTPVQNALHDLWALMDFAQPGLLGNHETFVKHFSEPIDQGSVRGATPFAVGLKKHLCEQLWRLIQPHMLRRTKVSVGLVRDACQAASSSSDPAPGPTLLSKTETVIWLMPTDIQVLAYKKVLETSEVIHQANTKAKAGLEVFRAIALLKRLCNHPILGLPMALPGAWQYLLTEAAGPAWRRRDEGKKSAAEEHEDCGAGLDVEGLLRELPRDAEALLSQSSKLKCLAAMLPSLITRGHRVLLFSQGVKMMDLVEVCILKRQGIPFLRIDGQADVQSRADRVRLFQEQPDRYQCMLLTTMVGGYGLNLTGADRVILLDPAWNPATDMQAVDRAFRIGQSRPVRVYRFVMSGLIEDKMFRLQVFKMGLTKTALEGKQQQRYFTTSEIRGLFTWTDPACGETRNLLEEACGKDSEEQLRLEVQADGGDEGWLEAGPAIGLSNFSKLYSAALHEEVKREAEQGAEADVSVAVRRKLNKADEGLRQASELRKGAEEHLQSAQRAMEATAQDTSSARKAKTEARKLLKERQKKLVELKRQQVATRKNLAKANRAQDLVKVKWLGTEKLSAEAEQALTTSSSTVHEAQQAVLAASEEVRKALVAVADILTWADAMAASRLKALQRSLTQARKAAEASFSAHDALTSVEDGVLQGIRGAHEASEGKEAKAREKELAKAYKCHEKALDKVEQLRISAAKAVSELLDNSADFIGALQSTRMAALEAFKQLGTTWGAVRPLQDAWLKVATARRRVANKAAAAAAASAAVGERLKACGVDVAAAQAQSLRCEGERVELEKGIEEAGSASVAAVAEEERQKGKRGECRQAVGLAKAKLKPVRAAQRKAKARRCSLADGEGKEEVEKTTENEAISALKALREEEYDLYQVEEAHQKKKLRIF